MAAAAILKLTLTANLVIIAHIPTKFGEASKCDVSVTGLPLVFTWENTTWRHVGKRHV